MTSRQPNFPILIQFLLFSIWALSLNADQFKQFETETSISSNWVRCIYEDETGYMWFGTMNGLNRFDGKDYKSYFPKCGNDGIEMQTSINFIRKKDNHSFWVGCDRGLYTFNPKNGSFQMETEVGEIPILDMIQDHQGNRWCATMNGCIIYKDQKKRTIHPSEFESDKKTWQNNYTNRLFQDSSNRIWLGTRTGIFIRDLNSDRWERVQIPNQTDSNPDFAVTSVIQDQSGDIWIGTARSGLYLILFESNKPFAKKMSKGSIISLLLDRNDNLWIGRSSREGLEVISIEKLKDDPLTSGTTFFSENSIENSLSDDSIFSIYEDSKNNIWIGTFGGGINFLSKKNKNFEVYQSEKNDENSITNNLVNCFFEDDLYLWIGSEGGLDRLNKSTKKIEHFDQDSPPYGIGKYPVFSLFHDPKASKLWIGTWEGGLFQFDYQTEQFKQYLPGKVNGHLSSPNIFSIQNDENGYLWLGTVGGGINRLNLSNENFESFTSLVEKTGESQNDLLLLKSNNLLISSYGNLALLNCNTHEITTINRNTTDKNNHHHLSVINSLFLDSNQHTWVGTSNGLELLNTETLEFELLHLKGTSIVGIQEDLEGHLWLLSPNGLIKFLNGSESPSNSIFLTTDKEEGLSGNEFKDRSISLGPTGYINVGTSTGFTRFDPNKVEFNTIPPKIVINDVSELQSSPDSSSNFVSLIESNEASDQLTIDYNQNHLLFSFAILNYINPNKNVYQYRMIGFDTNWIQSGNYNRATYTNLPAGKYTFEVKGYNNDGIESRNSATIKLVILPPWWTSPLFKILLSSTLILGLFYATWNKISSQAKKNKQLQIEVENRTFELTSANSLLEKQKSKIGKQNKELATHRDNLEDLVEQRTKELIIAKEKAEESDRLKSSFLANLNHEVRTPMNAIMGFSNLLTDPELKEKEKEEFIQLIEHNGNSLLAIVDDILDMSVIETNQVKLNKLDFKLSQLIHDLRIFYDLNNQSNLILKTKISDENAMVFADPNRLRQVMNNLIGNAFKFTKKGEIEFGFEIKSEQVKVFVRDTGIGIEADECDAIFGRFYKVEKKNAELYAGTGIGLAISDRLIKLHGSKIEVDSTVNVGSTFSFQLPLTVLCEC